MSLRLVILDHISYDHREIILGLSFLKDSVLLKKGQERSFQRGSPLCLNFKQLPNF